MRCINKRLFNTHTFELNWTALLGLIPAPSIICAFSLVVGRGGEHYPEWRELNFSRWRAPGVLLFFLFFFSSRRPPNKRCTSLKYITPASPAQPSSSCVSFCFSQHRISQRQHPFQTKHTHKHIYVLSFLLCFLKKSSQLLSVLFLSRVCGHSWLVGRLYRSNRWPTSVEMILF